MDGFLLTLLTLWWLTFCYEYWPRTDPEFSFAQFLTRLAFSAILGILSFAVLYTTGVYEAINFWFGHG